MGAGFEVSNKDDKGMASSDSFFHAPDDLQVTINDEEEINEDGETKMPPPPSATATLPPAPATLQISRSSIAPTTNHRRRTIIVGHVQPRDQLDPAHPLYLSPDDGKFKYGSDHRAALGKGGFGAVVLFVFSIEYVGRLVDYGILDESYRGKPLECAVKVPLADLPGDERRAVDRELIHEALVALILGKHPHIVAFYGLLAEHRTNVRGCNFWCMDIVRGTELGNPGITGLMQRKWGGGGVLHPYSGPLYADPEATPASVREDLLEISKQVASALTYMQVNRVVHQD